MHVCVFICIVVACAAAAAELETALKLKWWGPGVLVKKMKNNIGKTELGCASRMWRQVSAADHLNHPHDHLQQAGHVISIYSPHLPFSRSAKKYKINTYKDTHTDTDVGADRQTGG